MANPTRPVLFLIAGLILAQPAWTTEFDEPEPHITASPDSDGKTTLPEGERVQDLDASPLGGQAAILVESLQGQGKVLLWDLKSPTAEKAWEVSDGIRAKSLAWHPAGKAFFLLGRQGGFSVILKVEKQGSAWHSRIIHQTPDTLRRLVVGPRPFHTDVQGTPVEYRLFFGRKDPTGGFSILSITENGHKPYQVIGKASGITPDGEGAESPSGLVSPSALPIGFHPAGHLLIWEDAKSCFEAADYGPKTWGKSEPVLQGKVCGGTLTVSPNGLALLHWRPGRDGVESILFDGRLRARQAPGNFFAFTPSSTPDGKGLVGLVRTGGRHSVVYARVDLPLADVVNAWMFAESEADLERLATAGSVFRTTSLEQMYRLYETENYSCGEYDNAQPTRPYFVTTDAFWEVYAAAFEGLFVVAEKQAAIPAFWNFVKAAAVHFRTHAPGSRWSKVFVALDAVKLGKPGGDAEADRILAAQGESESPVLGRKVDYGTLKPRGNYAGNADFQLYFKAFTYLTRWAGLDTAALAELDDTPPALEQSALAWIQPYRAFISGSRSPLAWSPGAFRKPAYVKHPEMVPKVFPLSWAMDNEILNSTVYHRAWPEADQIVGPGGRRLMASALDIPAALGNPLALSWSQSQLEAYPNLGRVMRELGRRPWPSDRDSGSLYDRWMHALKVQWSATPPLPANRGDWKSWDSKRLQTGLASWATLRHATVLVNETGAAECGEGGYEEIILRPPRGYVEPDPATFRAIAGLFDAAAAELRGIPMGAGGSGEAAAGVAELREGLRKRLAESARTARMFAGMAEKHLHGEALTGPEYDAILTVGRVAEHHFLVYKSLSTKGMGLAQPEPMPKIADVARGPGGKPYLFAAVGHPLEWNQVVPYFGRREIVKGPAYSYYEFQSDTLFNDKEWQANLTRHGRPDWISPHITDRVLACPPRKPF